MEYPGYGLYTGFLPNETQILEDVESVLDFSVNQLGFQKENIVVIGTTSFIREVYWIRSCCPYSFHF